MTAFKGIAFSTIQNRDLSNLDARLSMIEEAGADHAELSLSGSDLISGGRVLPDRIDHLRAICDRHDLRYVVHGPLSANFMDTTHLPYFEAAVVAMLEICGAIGANVMVHHTGRVRYTTAAEIDRLHAQERDALRRVADVAARHLVRIAVETLFVENQGDYTADPFRLAAEIETIDHPNVIGTLDFSHVYIHTTLLGQSFRDALKAFAPVTGHLHVHDSFGRPKQVETYSQSEDLAFGLGDLHLPLGWGDIPWDQILPQLEFKDDTIFTIELPYQYAFDMARNVAEARRLIALPAQPEA